MATPPRRRLPTGRSELRLRAALRDEHLRRRATASLYDFLQLVWPLVEPTRVFVPNWHIELLCDYLEAVTTGVIRRLVINVPPRYGKSLLVSVVWPVWEWVRDPAIRTIFCSYGESLSVAHALSRRRLLTHPEFRQRWPALQLAPDQRTKLELHNRQGGSMVATSIGGAITGKGGSRLILDDPHNPREASSDALRQQAIDFYRETLLTRLDAKDADRVVLVMQRLHEQDLTQVCLDQGFTNLCLPAYEEEDRILTAPTSGQTLRRRAGEPLWPAMESRQTLDHVQRDLGSLVFAAQYLQAPVPIGGALFKTDWWRFYDVLPEDERPTRVVQAWDLALKSRADSDFVGGVVAQCHGADVYLLDVFERRASFTETVSAIRQCAQRYPSEAILIEDAANGPAVLDVLQREVPGVLPVATGGGKLARAHAVLPQLEAGNVWLPRDRDTSGAPILGREWVTKLMTTCARFPRVAHDDTVDALTHLLAWHRAHDLVPPIGFWSSPPDGYEEFRNRRLPPHLRHIVGQRWKRTHDEDLST